MRVCSLCGHEDPSRVRLFALLWH
jgi:hypothetical protein